MSANQWLATRIARAAAAAVVICMGTGLLTSCGPNIRHYRSYLYEQKQEGAKQEQDQKGDSFVASGSNSILVVKGRRAIVGLKEIRIGFVHREMKRRSGIGFWPDIGPYWKQFTPQEGLGGKELWLLGIAVPKDPTDPLGLKAQQLVYASSIKLDQESFSFLPIDGTEKTLLDVIANTSYDIDFRIYSVHGVEIKRGLLLAAKSSIGAWAWESLRILGTGMLNFLGEGLFTGIEGKAKQPLFFEQILLEAHAELEFKGSINLIAVDDEAKSDNNQAQSKPGRDFILYDIVKSEYDRDLNGKLDCKEQKEQEGLRCADNPPAALTAIPKDMQEYVDVYKFLHFGKKRRFPSADKVKEDLQSASNPTTEQLDDLARSYIRIDVREK